MIITDDFVWLHFPKCAGRKIEYIFERYFSDCPDIAQDRILASDTTARWHDSIAARESREPSFELGERLVICSFRRLPSWLESRYSYEVQRSPNLAHDPEALLSGKFLEASGYQNHADYYPRNYLPEFLLNSGNVRFIRMEFFEADFRSTFGDFVDVSRVPAHEYGLRENTSRSEVPPEIRERLNENRSVYEQCPYWEKVESLAYDC